ncbi:hypothetical protein RIF29_34923 [Crotalaria pallida]|uniref:Uncharacterized protein n=1 Tax=Crotalaria pallida TaxID=3830 RepID=A0AAN9EC21_CROPI
MNSYFIFMRFSSVFLPTKFSGLLMFHTLSNLHTHNMATPFNHTSHTTRHHHKEEPIIDVEYANTKVEKGKKKKKRERYKKKNKRTLDLLLDLLL